MNSPWDHDTAWQITKAMALARLCHEDPVQAVGVECANYVSAYNHALSKDSPAKTWWHLPFDHAAIARALRIERSAPMASYALRPFRYTKQDGRHLILAAYPTPCEFDPIDMDWLGIETVLAWEPVTGRVTCMTDDRPQLFGAVTADQPTLYADPRAFFTAWMRQRAWYATARVDAAKASWAAVPREVQTLPGALIVGDLDAIEWPRDGMPDRFTVVGTDPRAVNRAIFKSARLPFCAGAETDAARAA